MKKIDKLTDKERSLLPVAFAVLDQIRSLYLLATEYKVDITASSQKTGENIMHVGIRENLPEVVRYALNFPPLLDKPDILGITPRKLLKLLPPDDDCLKPIQELELFSEACESGEIGVVLDFLKSKYANPNLASGKGVTPFVSACENGHFKVVKALLSDSRVDVYRAGPNNCTPLWLASRIGHVDVVELLLVSERKIDQTTKSVGGEDWWCGKTSREVASAQLSRGQLESETKEEFSIGVANCQAVLKLFDPSRKSFPSPSVHLTLNVAFFIIIIIVNSSGKKTTGAVRCEAAEENFSQSCRRCATGGREKTSGPFFFSFQKHTTTMTFFFFFFTGNHERDWSCPH